MSREIVINVRKLKSNYSVETTKNKYKFSEETIIKYSIFKGKEIDNQEITKILEEEEQNNLMNRAINYLSYQARSENEIKKYIVDKGANEDLALIIIGKIKNLGYLNDEELAKSMLDYNLRTNKGPRVLEQKLQKKEISEKIIKNTLASYTFEMEMEVLKTQEQKLISRYKSQPLRKQQILIYQKLIRDGFSNEVVNEYINKINYVDESEHRLINELKKFKNRFENLNEYNTRSKVISNLMAKGFEYSDIIEKLDNLE